MMSEEEKKAIETFIKKCESYDGSVEIKGISVGEETRILGTIVKFLKELNNLKEIEKAHKEENGKLRVELEQEKEKYKRLQNTKAFQENYISKDKIKEIVKDCKKIKETHVDYYFNINEVIKMLEKVLEEK